MSDSTQSAQERDRAQTQLDSIAFRKGIGAYDLMESLRTYEAANERLRQYRRSLPAECRFELPFGQHYGKTLFDVAISDVDYLTRLAREDRTEFWRWSARVVLNWFRQDRKATPCL